MSDLSSLAARLRGINLGGWLAQSPLTDKHVSAFITAADIQRIASWQCNHVRVPVDCRFLLEESVRCQLREAGVQVLDRALGWCAEAGLRCVIVLHDGPDAGLAGATGAVGPDDDARNRLTALWRALAARYAQRPPSVFYELLHRPQISDAVAWRELARGLTAAIRQVDAHHTIIVSAAGGGSAAQFARLRPTGDANTLYALHFYEPWLFTHQHADWAEHHRYLPDAAPYPGRPPPLVSLPDGLLGQRLRAEADRHWDRHALAAALEPALGFRELYDVPRLHRLFWRLPAGLQPGPADLAALRAYTLRAREGLGWAYWSYKGLGFGLLDPGPAFELLPAYQNPLRLDYGRLALLQGA